MIEIDNENYNYLKPDEQQQFQKVAAIYKDNGFTEVSDCLDHVRMLNPETKWYVNLYFNGKVQEKQLI